MTRDAVIVDAVRTPVGKRGGQLRDWHPVDLLAHTLTHLVERSGVAPDAPADVIVGCALQRGEQTGNVARTALLGAGLPIGLPGTTLDRQCGSGQQSVHFAAQGVRSGEYDVAIGAGVESMSRVDLGPLFDPSGPRGEWYGERALARFGGNLPAQGPSAELVVAKWGYTRDQLDDYAVRSHQRAAAATEAGYFASQLVPLEGVDGPMTRDEGIRAAPDRQRMAALTPVFDPAGAITAGNSSQISDGAAALLVADRAYADAAGLRARARIVSMAVAADDPVLQFTAILAATRAALDRAGLTIGDIDLAEVNEAFAPVPMLWRDEFGYPDDQLNVNGGSIAIGHPLGSTGGRLLTQLLDELERREARYGLLTVCEAAGMANATVIERLP
ncbi:acetyl-CoA C-acetyltransferase [Pseudonocardia ammonioxydans]|uniref:Acetyl-CoA C-acetyltransferase n=1 Tax=Pseudonocardia ammonioxydans TaxID=260086 RepID=A0A1I4WZT8_PSUAM|nr:thiolase family protein [Pseudonocardia ammonioxydans]SFN18509.1 acetyl-CoA C-acetyltransferase [Pseudonocardia ammonioxydans]